MPLWEYKVITSGKGGFARPDMMEKFLNDLGREDWEIVSFHSHPDNFLAFTGLARRSTQRDWTLEDAAAAAAKVEADRLRAEFEAKFKAATSTTPAAAPTEETGTSFLEEKSAPEDGLRKLVDTSRDDDPEAAEDEKADAWDKLSSEDELPTFFEAMRPHMRRNQRGAGMSVGVDYLAKKWDLPEEDIKAALAECGFAMPEDEDTPVAYLEYDGDLFWVNINRRGELWINTKEKPRPVFRSVKGTRVEVEAPRPEGAPAGDAPAGENAPAAAAPAPDRTPVPLPEGLELLEKIRPQMRRNRRGPGASGSASFLSRAFRTNEAELKAAFGRLGLPLPVAGGETPAPIELAGLSWWLNLDSRGGLWINATERREGEAPAGTPATAEGETPAAAAPAEAAPAAAPVEGAAPAAALAEPPLLTEPPLLSASAPAEAAPVASPAPVAAPAPVAGEAPVAGAAAEDVAGEEGAAPASADGSPAPRLTRGRRPRSRPRKAD